MLETAREGFWKTMATGGLDGERLTEVSRLAGVLADQVLRDSLVGVTSPGKLNALGKAASLLQEYEQPVPDLVRDVLGRVVRQADGLDEASPAEAETAGAGPRRRLLPRLMQSLRLPRP